jgi:amidophosphoribosyltransferase
MKHYCGIYGIYYNKSKLDYEIINGLQLLQHRGQDSAGITYIYDEPQRVMNTYKNIGLVNEVFYDFKFDNKIVSSIGHVRYSTVTNEVVDRCKLGFFSLAHNGNIPNADKINDKYQIITRTNSDSDMLTKLIIKIADKYDNWDDVMKYIMNTIYNEYY